MHVNCVKYHEIGYVKMYLEYCDTEKCSGLRECAVLHLHFSFSSSLSVFFSFQEKFPGIISREKKKQKTNEKVETQKKAFWVLKRQKQPRNEQCTDVILYILLWQKEYLCLFPVFMFVYSHFPVIEMVTSWFHLWQIIKVLISPPNCTTSRFISTLWGFFPISLCCVSVIIQNKQTKKAWGGAK